MNDTIKTLSGALISEQRKWEQENVFLKIGDYVSINRLKRNYKGRIADFLWHSGRLHVTINEIHTLDFCYFEKANEKAKS